MIEHGIIAVGFVGYFQNIVHQLITGGGIVLENAVWLFIGILSGMILGVIPGMGGTVALTILLPFTLGLNPYQAFPMLTGAFGATTFTGSLTAILVNTPGSSSNAATLIDGYPLTQKGESVTAITVSAIASASGAILSGVILVLTIPLMIDFVLMFGPSEIFWIVLFAILFIPLMVSDRQLYGIFTAGLGAMVAFAGTSPQTGEPRFTFNQTILYDGVEIVPVLIGFFALAEIIRVSSLERNTIVDFDEISLSGSKIEGVRTVIRNKWLWLRSSLIGVIIGAVPGAGGSAAAFVAYAHAIQSSKTTDKFSKGDIRGVLAPEASNDAKDGGQLFPTLGLGIPGSASMAVFLAALLMHGFFPGPTFIAEETTLVFVIVISLMISNICTSIIGLTFAKQFTDILKVPIPYLLTAITVLALVSVYIVRNSTLDVFITIGFAIFGLLLIYMNISRIPFLIAFVLAAALEQNYHLSVRFADSIGEAFFAGAINKILIVILLISIILTIFPKEKITNRLI